jgi:hypothetical protein
LHFGVCLLLDEFTIITAKYFLAIFTTAYFTLFRLKVTNDNASSAK